MSTKLEELVVEIKGDTEGLRAELRQAQITMAEASKNMTASLSKLVQNSEKGFFSIKRAAEVMAGFIGGKAIIAAFIKVKDAAIALFQTTLVDGVRAAQAQEDAINRLNQALASSGKYTRETSKELIDLAQELQNTTKFSNDAIISAQGMIQTLGRLDKEGLKTATTATADLAAAMGMDLNQAATLVGKAAEGNIAAFKRYGITIQEGATKAETFANTLATLNSRFGGAAASQVNTFSGAFAQLQNRWADMTKELGEVITRNHTLIAVFKEIGRLVSQFGEHIKKNSDGLREFTANGIIYTIKALNILLIAFDAVWRAGKAAIEALMIPVKALATAIMAAAQAADGNWKMAWETMKSNSKAAMTDVVEAATGPTGLTKISEALQGLESTAVVAFETTKGMAAELPKPLNNAAGAARSLSSEMERLGDAGEKLAASLTEVNPGDQMKRQLEMEKIALAEHQLTLEDFHMLELEAQQEKHDAELAQLNAALKQKKISRAMFNEAVRELDARFAEDQEKLRHKQREEERKHLQDRLGQASQFFGDLSTLQKTGSRELYAVGKAAAIAQAVIDGYAAVQKALASAPPPLNYALAAAVGVKTAANVAAMQSQSPKFAKGVDRIPGIGTQDNFPALLAPGEGVLTRENNKKFAQMVREQERGGGSGGGEIHNHFHFHGHVLGDESAGEKLISMIQSAMDSRDVGLRGFA